MVIPFTRLSEILYWTLYWCLVF